MTLVVLPFRPNPGELEDVTQIMLDFDAILNVLNGGITSDNIAPDGLDSPAIIGPALEQQLSTPPGVIMPYGGAAAPAGYLLCDGTPYPTSTYQALFNVIGYEFGGSGGSFSVPNLKGRIPAGYDAAQAEFSDLGKQDGGEKAHLLLAAESGVKAHGHGFNDPGHVHDTNDSIFYNAVGISFYNQTTFGDVAITTNPAVTTDGAFTGGSVAGHPGENAGAAHNNLQPYVVVNYIIKT